jgi:hypothetical protein
VGRSLFSFERGVPKSQESSSNPHSKFLEGERISNFLEGERISKFLEVEHSLERGLARGVELSLHVSPSQADWDPASEGVFSPPYEETDSGVLRCIGSGYSNATSWGHIIGG